MRMASGVSLGEPVADVEVFSLDEPSPRESGQTVSEGILLEKADTDFNLLLFLYINLLLGLRF